MDYHSFDINETECSTYNNNTHIVRQFNFFQFSSSQVLETFRTIFTDSWSIVIQGTTIHLLIQHLNLTEMRINRAIDSLKHALIDRLLQNGKSIIISRSKLVQSSLNLFCVYYNCEFVNNKRRLQLIIENLDKKEFIVRLDNEINLEREFSKFFSNGVCTENQLEISIKAINNAYEEKRKLIKNLLLRQRILKFIGFPKEKYIADQIQELSEIMSDLSNQQIHLCLRHFGYDIEKTTEALCQREQLPLNLKILLRVKDNLEEDNCCPKQALVSDENLEIEDLNELIKSNEATINIDGKLFAPKSSQKDLSEDERIALATASIKLAEMIEEENSNPNEVLNF
uniref:UBA domain-containing protein n=1 Tax=Meloidogyne javanica TaxID=6303 RepID=A0A915MYI3_MELJA